MLHIDLLPMRVLSALAFLSASANLYHHQTIYTPVLFNNNSNWPPLILHGTKPFPVPSNSILRFLPFICVSGCGCAWPTGPASSYLLGLCHQTLLLVSAAWYMNAAMSLWRPRGTPTRYQCDLRGALWSLTAAAVQGQKMWCQTRGWLQKAFQHSLKWLGKKKKQKKTQKPPCGIVTDEWKQRAITAYLSFSIYTNGSKAQSGGNEWVDRGHR